MWEIVLIDGESGGWFADEGEAFLAMDAHPDGTRLVKWGYATEALLEEWEATEEGIVNLSNGEAA